MCLAIPFQIVEISGTRGRTELNGNVREADLTLIENPAIGDWVLVHAGFAIERLEPEEAEETLKLFAEMEGIG